MSCRLATSSNQSPPDAERSASHRGRRVTVCAGRIDGGLRENRQKNARREADEKFLLKKIKRKNTRVRYRARTHTTHTARRTDRAVSRGMKSGRAAAAGRVRARGGGGGGATVRKRLVAVGSTESGRRMRGVRLLPVRVTRRPFHRSLSLTQPSPPGHGFVVSFGGCGDDNARGKPVVLRLYKIFFFPRRRRRRRRFSVGGAHAQ